jgi:hypothetical protein
MKLRCPEQSLPILVAMMRTRDRRAGAGTVPAARVGESGQSGS